MSVLFRIFIVFGLSFWQPVFALEVSNLFETQVLANSQTVDDRDAAIKQAMAVVLQRVVAGNNILNDPTVQMALRQAPFYVKQYQYALVENGSDPDSSARLMRILFDENSLLDLLKTGKQGVWTEVRPQTLVWLVVDDQGQRRFFKPEIMPRLDNALDKAAGLKGLPLIFPLLDLEERARISVNDVLSAYPQRLLDASERYDVVSILAGRVVNKQNCWQAEWAFYFDGTVSQWMQPCAALDATLLDGMAGAYDKLSHYYGVKPDVLEAGVVLLNVSGITGMEDIGRVADYLKSLPMVKTVQWVMVKNGFNQYKIHFEGDRRVLENQIGSGRMLRPSTKAGVEKNELSFGLVPEADAVGKANASLQRTATD